MGFFQVKAGSDKVTIVNRDCGARLVLDFLRDRLGITDSEVELDLCDEWGNLRFLTQAPLRCSCLLLVASRALYTPVVIRQTPVLKFEFPMGQPVPTHKSRDAQRKVRRQWDKFQKLRAAAGGRFASDKAAAELIYEVVGSPSTDLGKSKGKARDPAPKAVRTRSGSAGRRRKASPAARSSEEKENNNGNDLNKPEKTVMALKIDGKVEPLKQQSIGREIDDTNVAKEVKTSVSNASAKTNEIQQKADTPLTIITPKKAEVNDKSGGTEKGKPKNETITSSIGRPHTFVTDNEINEIQQKIDAQINIPQTSISSKQAGANDKPGDTEKGKPKDETITSSISKPHELAKDNEIKVSDETQLSEMEKKKYFEFKDERTVKNDGTRAEIPEGSNQTNGNRPQCPFREPTMQASTDSGIESAVSRSHRRLKNAEPKPLSDGQSVSIETGSNEESTCELVLSQSKSKLKHSGIISDNKELSTWDNRSGNNIIQIKSDNDQACRPEAVSETLEAESNVMIRNIPDTEASSAEQKPLTITQTADAAREDIAGATVSIIPPNLTTPHRSSINATTLLDIDGIDKRSTVAADTSTRKGVPSLIDEEWRRTVWEEQLAGVLSGTSRLAYLGSARGAAVSGRQVEVIRTTEEEARRLEERTTEMRAAAGRVGTSGGVEIARVEREEDPVLQCSDGADTWKASSSVIET